jgi:hypothetical protein
VTGDALQAAYGVVGSDFSCYGWRFIRTQLLQGRNSPIALFTLDVSEAPQHGR